MMDKSKFHNAAVSGKSILTSSAKILSKGISNCTYLEYRTFCDFVEATVINDNIIILGNFKEQEKKAKELFKKLNDLNDKPFIHIENIHKDKLIVNDINLDKTFRDIVNNTFQNQTIEFVRHQLFQKAKTNRYTDDEKTEYLKQFIKLYNDNCNEDWLNSMEQYLATSYKSSRNSEFTRYLFRAFMVAAYSKCINGTALFTGSRKPIGAIIKERNSDISFMTLPTIIYRYANSILLANRRDSFVQEKIQFNYPLLISTLAGITEDKNNVLGNILYLRKNFQKYRKNIIKKSNTSNSAKDIRKKEKYIDEVNLYLNERGRLFSDNNFKNLGKKYSKELILDKVDAKWQVNNKEEDSNNQDQNEAVVNSSVSLIKIIKNIIKFLSEFIINIKIKKQTNPLGKYLCYCLNNEKIINPINKIIKIEDYNYQKMREFDKFTNNYNI